MTDKQQTKIAIIGLRGFPGVQGGVESHCMQLIPRLAKKYSCIVYRRKPYLTSESFREYDSVSYVDLPSTRIKGFEAVFHTLLCVMHLLFHRVDIVNVHNIGPGMFTPLLRLIGYRVVLTYHSPNYEHNKWGKISKAILRFSETLSLRYASHIIFVSPFQRAKYPPRIQAKSSTVANGINELPRTDSISFLQKHSVKPEKYILAVGRITPEKGFGDLVLAIQGLDSVEQLVIAGSSDHNPNAIGNLKKIDKDNKVQFTGYTSGSDLAQLYQHARAFVLSSLAEGFPMVLLEAMSFNLPIIASDIPAAHIIELPPDHYSPAGNPEQLAKTIQNVLTKNPPPSYQLKDYNWDSIAEQTAEIYQKTIHT